VALSKLILQFCVNYFHQSFVNTADLATVKQKDICDLCNMVYAHDI